MEIKENNQKKLFLSVLGIAILVVAVIGISFAIYQATFTQSKDNSITTGTITVSYTEPSNAITIENAMPMDESEALETLTGTGETFKFTVSTNASGKLTVPYEISITNVSEEGDTSLENSAVRVYLTKGGNPVDLESTTSVSEPEGQHSQLISNLKDSPTRSDGKTKLLYKTEDVFADSNNNAINTEYELRMWLDSGYEVDDSSQKTYKAKVNVDSAVTPIGTQS